MNAFLFGVLVCFLCLPNEGTSQQTGLGFELQCYTGSIVATFTKEHINQLVPDVSQGVIHFNGHLENQACVAERSDVDNSYSLTLYPPYTECGTELSHDTGNYLYSNTIVFSSGTLMRQGLYTIKCDYDDKYNVTADISLKPVIRTLTVATANGEIGLEMNIYQRKDYHPKSRLGDRPLVIVGVPIYVSVDMMNVFGGSDVVTTLEACYATTSPEPELMENYHYLIVDRCVDAKDETVKIYANGEGTKARYSFQMFRWRNTAEYIYLHCEVYVCDTNAENCTGSGPQCKSSFDPASNRRKREVNSAPKGIISEGPIAIVKENPAKATFKEAVVEGLRNDQDLLWKYILAAVGGAVLLICICLVIYVIIRTKRLPKKKMKSVPVDLINKEKPLPNC
ncbi:pancreatic secretory granule membrane major glycoprotein GP2-like [Clavelina lepadiformis]|uniref:pancreatic secretory granule membrane major glycoprotein GP2-like n=1 Tax=Clavelina lepadiformis TaxID=159417 RepID=UPI00404268B2